VSRVWVSFEKNDWILCLPEIIQQCASKPQQNNCKMYLSAKVLLPGQSIRKNSGGIYTRMPITDNDQNHHTKHYE